jgi:hypothetical protein
MKKLKYILTLFIFSQSLYAVDFDSKIRGTFGLQTKRLENSATADDFGQDWEKDDAFVGYANMDVKLEILNSKFDANWFVRHAESDLYDQDKEYVAPFYFNFPNRVVSRNVFKTRHIQEGDNSRTESIVNQFIYEWGDQDTSFTVGRMFIEFGEGYFFNPIDPFMLPLALSTLQGVQQGNDGMAFAIDKQSDIVVNLYLLGDRQFTDFDGRITRTIFIHGDWNYSKQTHVNYILGEDQKRHKYGFEIKHNFDQGLIYTQVVRQSQRLDKEEEDDKGLGHFLVGYEKDLTKNLTTRLEFGKHDIDDTFPEAEYERNFLPVEDFVGISNLYRFNDQNFAIIQGLTDTQTRMLYLQGNFTHRLKKWFEVKVFAKGVVARSKDDDDSAQRTIPREFGMAFQSQF